MEDKFIQVVHEDENVIVVDKPATLPVHPCGSYFFNSLFHILSEQDPSLKGRLHTVHRLDRLTSGLTIIAKSTTVAKSLAACITARDDCRKVYIARVLGKFPLRGPKDKLINEETGNALKPPLTVGESQCNTKNCSETSGTESITAYWIMNGEGTIQKKATLLDVFQCRLDVSKLQNDGNAKDVLWLNLSCPCEIIDHKNGVCQAGSGKEAQTSFAVVRYDERTDSTVVICKPLTG